MRKSILFAIGIIAAAVATPETKAQDKTITILDARRAYSSAMNLPPQIKQEFLRNNITVDDVNKFDAIYLMGNQTPMPFEPGALEAFLQTKGKLLILEKCRFKADTIRKKGWNYDEMMKLQPKGKESFAIEDSTSPSGCDILRIFTFPEKPNSPRVQEVNAAVNSKILKLLASRSGQ